MFGDRTLSRLERLLQREGAALMSGDLAALASIADEREALSEKLAARPAGSDRDAAILRRIAGLSERNRGLLEAARRGVEAGRTRVEEIAAARRVETYSQMGARSELHLPRTTLHKRA